MELLKKIYINTISYSELGKASQHVPQRPREPAIEYHFHTGLEKTKLMPWNSARRTTYQSRNA